LSLYSSRRRGFFIIIIFIDLVEHQFLEFVLDSNE
jgi:hypothetical protein